MCTNLRPIKNKYTGKVIYVACGKCPACQEAKALARTCRIRNTYDSFNIALFVTLTYKNEFIPYIKRSELVSRPQFVRVYRDAEVRRKRVGSNYEMAFNIVYKTRCIDEKFVEYDDAFDAESLYSIVHGDSDKISCPYYKDLQNFEKRLSIILKRKGYFEKFQYYQCNELGPSTQRSHFHLLMFIRPSDEEIFRDAVLQAWPFADYNRTKRNIEIAKNASSYVSKYVNRGSSTPRFFTQSAFRQKHSYSQGFGLGRYEFTFANIQKALIRRDLSYFVERKVEGVSDTVNLPIPKYVINRYFPLFKGYSRIDVSQIRGVISSLIRYSFKLFKPSCLISRKGMPIFVCDGFKHPLTSFPLDFVESDYHSITVKLKNAYLRCCENGFVGTPEDYAIMYVEIWDLWKNTCLRLSFDDCNSSEDYMQHYDNISEFLDDSIPYHGRVRSFSLEQVVSTLPLGYNIILNPNEFTDRVLKTSRLSKIYHDSYKKRKVTNYSMSVLYGDV